MSEAHYMRRLSGERWPRRVLYVHAEPLELPGGRMRYHLGAGIAVELEGEEYHEIGARLLLSGSEVWEWVERWCRERGETRLYAYGLEDTLGLTRARARLSRSGWVVDRFAMRERAGWWRWSRGDRRLVLCDAASFLGNASVETFARELGCPAPAEPELPVGLEEWSSYVLGRVWLLRSSLERVWEWYRSEGLGGLQLTGAGMGMAAYRRRFLPDRGVLVHTYPEIGEAEREATWAGRCEGWRWGRVEGPLEEWDYELAYPALAAGAVPAKLDTWGRLGEGEGLRLARCSVATREPLVPASGGDRGVIFPTGRYRTTLWEPELRLLEEMGAELELEQVWRYYPGRILEEWSRWVCELALEHPSGAVRRIAKGWSRSVIGSFGLRYQSWEPFSEEVGLEIGEADIAAIPYSDEGRESQLLYLAGTCYELGELEDSENACPQVQGYVWSLARVALWRAMVAAGLEHVVYVDTDSLIVTPEGGDRLRRWSRGQGAHPRLRLKSEHEWVEVYGSRQLITPEGVRISGLKRGAVRTEPMRWEADVWESMPSALGGSEGSRLVRRGFTLGRGELRRDRLRGGSTRPVRV